MDTLEDDGDLLYNLACHCETLFDTWLAEVKEHPSPLASLIAEYQQRFSIWAAYLGVFARRSQSLDTRLQSHPDIQDLVARLLDILWRSLQQLVRPNGISGEIDTLRVGDNVREKDGDAGNEALDAVETTLDRLDKLGITIRQSSRDRIDIKVKMFAANLDLGPFDAVSQAAVQTLYPEAHPSLRKHLSKTMTDRYATMVYSQHRGSTLESRRQEASFNPMRAIGEESEADTPGGDLPDEKSGRVLDSLGLQKAPASVSPSGLSTINSLLLRQGLSGSSNLGPTQERRKGTYSVQANQANYPRPPFRKYNDLISCEFCTRAVHKKNTTERDWRRHIDEDLKPYTCISEECPDGQPTYPDFSDWFQHMTQCHGEKWYQRVFLTSGWICVVCGNSDPKSYYTSPEELHLHLTQTHVGQFSANVLQAISRQSRVERPRPRNKCPLCCFLVEEVRAPDETMLPKRRREQVRRGSNKIPKRPHDLGPQPGMSKEGHSRKSGDSSDDSSEDPAETTTSDNPERMAQHIAAHLQVLMLLTIRFSAVQREQSSPGDDVSVNSASVDIGDSKVPSREGGSRETEDTGSSLDHDMPDPSEETFEHIHMAQDDRDIPDADVDFSGVCRQYDELAVEEDQFLQDLILSGAFKSHLEPRPSGSWEIPLKAGHDRKRTSPLSNEPVQSERTPPLGPNQNISVDGGNQLACTICHYKKIRCQVSSSDPRAACQNCAARPSLCYRHSVTEVSFYREQDAPFHLFCRRWTAMEVVDIEGWASNQTLTIEVTPVSVVTPYTLEVRKFIPRGADMVEAVWHIHGEKRSFAVPPYAIASMADAASAIDAAVSRGMSRHLKDFTHPSSDYFANIFRVTFDFAFKYSAQVQDKTVKSLIHKNFRLWVACYLTSHPQAIVGEETLGMPQAVIDQSSPWANRYPAPPVLSVQLECIIYTEFLRPLSLEVRELLDLLFKKRKEDAWLGAYLTTFVMLHSCCMLTRRQEYLARQFNFEAKYASPEAVKELQRNAAIILAHFHGVVAGPTPLRLAGTGRLGDYREQWGFTPEQESFMKMTYLRQGSLGEQLTAVRERRDPSEEWYWVSQLYDEDWSPDKMD